MSFTVLVKSKEEIGSVKKISEFLYVKFEMPFRHCRDVW